MEEMRTGTRVERKKKKVWPWIAGVVVIAAAVVAAVLLRPRPLVTAQAYVAADLETAPIYNEEGAACGELVRGSTVTYVVEEANEERRHAPPGDERSCGRGGGLRGRGNLCLDRGDQPDG